MRSLGMTEFEFCDEVDDFTDSTENPKLEGFVMCYSDQLDRYLSLFKDKSLRPRDSAIVFGLLSFYNPRTGLCHVSVAHLSEVMGASISEVSGGLSRLKKCLMVATYIDKVSKHRSFLLNPFIFVSGGKAKRAFLQTRFKNLVNS